MCSEFKLKLLRKKRRKLRISATLCKEKHQLVVFRSLKHIYAQIICQGKTIVGSGSVVKSFKDLKGPILIAEAVGKEIASLAKKANIEKVVFNRGSYKFHGRVAALAKGARDGGLKF